MKKINSLRWVLMPRWIQQLSVDGVNQPVGFFTTVLLCWRPEVAAQVGGLGPGAHRPAVGQGAWWRGEGPGCRPPSAALPASRTVALAAGSKGSFRCISVKRWQKHHKLCLGNGVKRKQEKAGQNSKWCFCRGKEQRRALRLAPQMSFINTKSKSSPSNTLL